jgi:hypothetical protein
MSKEKQKLNFIDSKKVKESYIFKSCINKNNNKSLLIINKSSGNTISLSENYVKKIFENESNVKIEKVKELVSEVKDMI